MAFLNVLAGLCAAAVERLRLATDRSHVRELLRRRELALHAAGTQIRVGTMRIELVVTRRGVGYALVVS